MRPSPPVREALMEYGPAFVGAGLWAFAKFPGQLHWAARFYGRSFGLLASLYEDVTEVEGYGAAMNAAVGEIRNIPRRVIDLATGTGYGARVLKRLYPASQVTAVDVTGEMVSVARHLASAERLDINFEVADNSDLPFEDGSFDLVVLQNSLPYPEEMLRVTSPGGMALFVVSWAGPWVQAAWPAIAGRMEAAGASETRGRRASPGFYGVARKAGSMPRAR